MGEDGGSARAWRRRALYLFASVAALAVALRVVLTLYAAELFVAALGRTLAGSNAEVVFAEPPSVTAEGFSSKGVVLRSLDGKEWARADAASGSAHLFLRAPYISVALELKNARTNLGSSAASTSDGLPIASLPSSISRIAFENATIDLGEGRTFALDAVATSDRSGATILDMGRLEFVEPEGKAAAEKLAGRLAVTTISDTGTRVNVAFDSGAALYGPVLFDFAAHPLAATALLQGEGEKLTLGDVTFTLGKLLGGSGSITLKDGALESANLRMTSDDLAAAFATLVREPFSGVTPALSNSELQGRGEITLELAAPSRHRADVSVTLALKSLRTRSLEATDVAIDLPWIGAERSGSTPRSGRLRAGSLSLLGLSWSAIDIPIEAQAGRVRAKNEQEWKGSGGTMRVAGLLFEDDALRGPRLSGDVRLEGFDLAQLGETFGRKGLSGSLDGDLGRVRIDADAVRVAGNIEIRAFGGTARLSKLVVESPFGRVPELGLDASLREIDLASFTRAFGFGRVSGVLEGDVTGLVLAAGQLQAFDADLHTVERRGVSQTIDVRAISQLGALGGDTGSLTGSLLRVIDRYRYSAMGIRCRLRNDVFELRGVESHDGKDYLVKGSLLPPSVSVVSHSQVLSFSEMLRRIERITAIGQGGSPDAEP